MKTYIGTKIIEAVPAIRKGCKVYEKDQPIAMGMVPFLYQNDKGCKSLLQR